MHDVVSRRRPNDTEEREGDGVGTRSRACWTRTRPGGRNVAAATLAVLALLCPGCGDRSDDSTPAPGSPAAIEAAGLLARRIEGARIIRVADLSEIDAAIARRDQDVAALVALGTDGCTAVIDMLDAQPPEAGALRFWAKILARFPDPRARARVDSIGLRVMDDNDRTNLIIAALGNDPAWVVSLAERVLVGASVSLRVWTVHTLRETPSDEACNVALRLLASDPNANVRRAAAGLGNGKCCQGGTAVLEALVRAIDDPSDMVRASAVCSLDLLVSPEDAPPKDRLPNPPTPEELDQAIANRPGQWLAWWPAHRDRLTWNAARRVFVAR